MKVTFLSVAENYLNSRFVSERHSQAVLRAASKITYLDNFELNKYLKSRLEKFSTATVRHDRTILLSLWKFAYENDIIDHLPRNVVKIKQRRKPTKAWTVEECKTIVNKTFEKDTLKLKKTKISLGIFLRCWILIGYECGARLGDIFSFKYEDLENNALRWTMSKTGDPMTKMLSDKAVESINELKKYNTNNDPKIMGWVISKRQAIRLMKSHLKECGLDGSSKFLRRSGATHIEIDNPGYAKLHLGHRTSGLAEKNYIDYAQVRKNIPIVPKLL